MQPYPLSPTVGTIQPEKIVGRDKELDSLRLQLQAQSVTIEEFRRMGKTLLVQKLEHLSQSQNEQNKVVYFMLQGVKDVTELTDVLLNVLRKKEQMGWLKVGWNAVRKLYNAVKPDEVKIHEVSFKLPEFKTRWKEALEACIEDVAARTRRDDEIITLVLDEFPVMLWDWIENGKAQDATELLDVFRRLRINQKEQGRIRFIICGSVGMQVVLNRLRREHKYTGEPFNDTAQFRLESMSDDDAIFLCKCLSMSGFTFAGHEQSLFIRICQFTERLPFYINKVFQIIQIQQSGIISDTTIEYAENALLNDPDQVSTFDQLYQRITIYYEQPQQDLMLALLDYLCKQNGYVSETDLQQNITAINPRMILDALDTLRKEQYIVRSNVNGTRQYQFKYNLIKTWWRLNKA